MMRIVANKGFHMVFNNGLTISCQMGNTNYCNNKTYNFDELICNEMKKPMTECENCEVAIWDKHDNWITREIFEEMGLEDICDDVAGWIDTMTVAKLIAYVSTR